MNNSQRWFLKTSITQKSKIIQQDHHYSLTTGGLLDKVSDTGL